MDFKKATDVLCEPVTHEEVAKALGVRLPSVRQARLSRDAQAYRSAPAGWREAVIKLAEARARRLRQLAEKLREETSA